MLKGVPSETAAFHVCVEVTVHGKGATAGNCFSPSRVGSAGMIEAKSSIAALFVMDEWYQELNLA